MAYQKTHWVDNSTKVTATRLNNMEQGIEDAQAFFPNNEGSTGYVLTKTATGTEWSAAGTPTGEQVAETVTAWLDAHPEATTTVADGSITIEKLDTTLQGKVTDLANLDARVGNLSDLDTTVKANIVSAINEARNTVANGAVTAAKLADDTLAMFDSYANGFTLRNGLLYLTHDGTIISDGISVASEAGLSFATGRIDNDGYMHLVDENGFDIDDKFAPFYVGTGGGGGGGGSGNNAALSLSNTSGWLSKTITEGAECAINLTWSSIENGMATGAGTITVRVNNITRINRSVNQGPLSIDITGYLGIGSNSVRVTVTDVYGNSKTLIFSVDVISLKLESSFDNTVIRESPFDFPFVATGAVTKLVHFVLDGREIGTMSVVTSGRQQLFNIPAQSHGDHVLEVYFTATVNEDVVESNHISFAFIYVVPGNDTVVIASSYEASSVLPQYSTAHITYLVYNPNALTTPITLAVDDHVVSTLNVGRSIQTWSYRGDTRGVFTLSINAGDDVKKEFSIRVASSEIDIEAETSGLALYLSSNGRSNNESSPGIWSYNGIDAVFQNFNFAADGWKTDESGNTVLRVMGDARVTIPYRIFDRNFIDEGQGQVAGKTIEVDFSTRDVTDYNTVVLSCWSRDTNGNYRGLQLTPQRALIKSANTELSTLYKDNEHVRVTFVIDRKSANGGYSRLVSCYINGVMSGAIQYGTNDDFQQTSPVGITIGSDGATIDVYTIRVYDQDLSREAVLKNWIADTQDVNLMLERYNRNQVYTASGSITTQTLPATLPYFILSAPELPQFKGDKKTIYGSYVNNAEPEKSFTFTGCQINVQGTSSAPYYRKNYDMQFKEGFLHSGAEEAVPTYALRDGSIPFNRFVIKADVASSESANNTRLTMYYNDTCPYKTPEMAADSRVRWGIEGIPIAVFWENITTGEVQFMGKYNFNLPKRAPDPLGYTGNDQSWEWERNNSANVKFQDTDFTSTTWSETDQKYYPTWYDDFEARFPSDEWRDYTKLNEFLTWVKSTWRDEATNATLSPSVTYTVDTSATIDMYSSDNSFTVVDEMSGGATTGRKIITFTKDTPAYRLTKFRAELPDYAEVESAVFYYLFTEFFLMIDSRAKNMFVGFHGSQINNANRVMDRKAVFEPYDMDTAIGTNNSGVLMFGYYLEDTDKVSSIISGEGSSGSEANVYNAQDSVFWVNLRDAFRAEVAAMYRELRTSRKWIYRSVRSGDPDGIEDIYEKHQRQWAEAIFNEDSYIKYLVPLVNPVTVDETTGNLIRTNRYLTMLQGSKEEQRKWWLWNRFRYMDSKFVTGDAASNIISMRLFNRGTMTITPAVDLYACVSFGGGTTPQLKRTNAKVPVSFTYAESAQEMETWIYSADLITDIGDLSVFYPNELDLSKATRLERLQVGSNASGYTNANLTSIDVSNSTMLKYIDLRNCPNLAQEIDLSNSVNLEEAYFEGTSITSVRISNGGFLRVLHLPETVTTLIAQNQPLLTDLQIAAPENISTLVLENVSTVFDSYALATSMQKGGRARLIGIEWNVDNADDIIDLLRSLRGIDENGNTTNTAQLSGSIHFGSIRRWQLANLNYRYPYLTITYDSLLSNKLTLYNNASTSGFVNNIFTGVKRFPANSRMIYGVPSFYFPDMDSASESINSTIAGTRNNNSVYGFGKQGDTEAIALASSSYVSVTDVSTYTMDIYVPDTLVNTFKTATNWSVYADKIKPLSNCPIASWNGGEVE